MFLQIKPFAICCVLWFACSAPGFGSIVDLTDPNFSVGNAIDSWDSNMVIQESYHYVNSSVESETIHLREWSFDAGANRGRVTPFLVVLNDTNGNGNIYDDNSFTVKWIGTTAISDRAAGGIGFGDWGNPNVGSTITMAQSGSFSLDVGETLAIGFLNSDPDGTNTADPGSVITWSNNAVGSGQMWYNGNSSPNIYPRGVPQVGNTFGGTTLARVSTRSYNFGISLTVNPEPTSAVMFAMLIPLVATRRRSA